MPTYIVNKTKDAKKRHEVHQFPPSKCSSARYPAADNRAHLGAHDNCHKALAAAVSKGYKPADGCWFCSRDCHKG